MAEGDLQDWLDRHHVDIIRTFATTLDGFGVGKYVQRNKFTKTLPAGHAIADVAASMDFSGMPHLTFWTDQRKPAFGDVYLRPDMTTLISDGTDKALGHCMCDFTDETGEPLMVCPRSQLKRLVAELANLGGYTMKCTFELEFFLFNESYDDLRRKGFRHLNGVSATDMTNIYMVRNSYLATGFMNEVIKRMEWKGIAWEGWNDEGGIGQFELNLVPSDPVASADAVMRTKQILHEVAVDRGQAVTFMAKPTDNYGSGMHIHHSLAKGDSPAFFDANAPDNRTDLMRHWIGGLIACLPGAVSFLCPTVNSYRRMTDFSAVPTTANWGEDNKSTALRSLSKTPGATRVEYRLGAGDLNPYLALATIIASGLAGVRHELDPGPEFTGLAWGMPQHIAKLPNTISKAMQALASDRYLKESLGSPLIDYWLKSRELEWLAFHTEGGDPQSTKVSEWEYKRYFALV